MSEATTILPSARAELVVSSFCTTSAGDPPLPAPHPAATKRAPKTSTAATRFLDHPRLPPPAAPPPPPAPPPAATKRAPKTSIAAKRFLDHPVTVNVPSRV